MGSSRGRTLQNLYRTLRNLCPWWCSVAEELKKSAAQMTEVQEAEWKSLLVLRELLLLE